MTQVAPPSPPPPRVLPRVPLPGGTHTNRTGVVVSFYARTKGATREPRLTSHK